VGVAGDCGPRAGADSALTHLTPTLFRYVLTDTPVFEDLASARRENWAAAPPSPSMANCGAQRRDHDRGSCRSERGRSASGAAPDHDEGLTLRRRLLRELGESLAAWPGGV